MLCVRLDADVQRSKVYACMINTYRVQDPFIARYADGSAPTHEQ